MATFDIEVTQLVRVTLDETKFDDAFMAEFRESFYPFFTVSHHAEHIGQLVARGICGPNGYSGEFIEGYGNSSDLGISAEVIDTDVADVTRPGGAA